MRICYARDGFRLAAALAGLAECRATGLILDHCGLETLPLPAALARRLCALGLEDNLLSVMPDEMENLTRWSLGPQHLLLVTALNSLVCFDQNP